MKEYSQLASLEYTTCIWQAVANLRGSENTCKLTGEFMDEDELLKDAQAHNRALSIVMLRRLQLYSSFWFDNYEQVMELRNEVDENTIRMYLPGLFGGLLVCFHNSLAAISMYHKTKSRKYYKIASQLRGHISAAVEVGVSTT